MGERYNGTRGSVLYRRVGRRGVFPTSRGPSVGGWRPPEQRRLVGRGFDFPAKARLPELEATELGLGNRDLPIYGRKQEIIDAVARNKVVQLSGETGSGKSTQLPQYLYEAGYDKIFMLVPRKVIAENLFNRLRAELADQLGADEASAAVGIAHGDRSEFTMDSKIMVVTSNTFNRMEPWIRAEYDESRVVLIVDEIHEANLYSEIATGVAADGVAANKDWHMVVASATHDRMSLVDSLAGLNEGGVLPEIAVEGRPFEVKMCYEPTLSAPEVYREVGAEHDKSIIFTSGKKEIDYIIGETKRLLGPDASRKVVFRRLHSELTPVEMAAINDPVGDGQRLVIVSSPAGNSGITIPGTTLVVTDGTINRGELDNDGVPGLVRHYASRDEIIQQSGRAGRDVSGGVAFLCAPTIVRDYSGELSDVMPYVDMEHREQHAPAEIYNTNLSRVVLSVAALGRQFAGVNQYLPHAVHETAIISAEESLARLGALDFDNGAVTALGRRMDQFSVSPELSRGVVRAIEVGETACNLARIMAITAAIDSGGLQDFRDRDHSKWKQLLRPTTRDDFIAQLDLFAASDDKVYGMSSDFAWLSEHAIHYKRTEQAKRVYRKLMAASALNLYALDISDPTPNDEDKIRESLAAGMIDFAYRHTGMAEGKHYFTNIHTSSTGKERMLSNRSITPGNSHYVVGFPRWYITHSAAGPELNHIIELTMPVDPLVIGRYALERGILGARVVAPRIEGDTVVEYQQPTFGVLDVGDATKLLGDIIPTNSAELLARAAINQPGRAQQSLRELVRDMRHIKARIPEAEWSDYFFNIDQMPTTASIDALVSGFAERTRSLHEVDQLVAGHIYHNNIDRAKFISNDDLERILERSPDSIEVNDEVLRLNYKRGQPFVTGLSDARIREIGRNIHLADGRSVLVEVAKNGGRGIYFAEIEDLIGII